jgi:hypothetical protein
MLTSEALARKTDISNTKGFSSNSTAKANFVNMQKSKFSLGFGYSQMIYLGDLEKAVLGSFARSTSGCYGSFSYQNSPAIIYQTSIIIGNLKGDESSITSDEYRYHRNFRFTSFYKGAYINIKLMPFARRFKQYNPYLKIGVGFLSNRADIDYSKFNKAYFNQDIKNNLLLDAAEDNKLNTFIMFPAALGCNIELNSTMNMVVDFSYYYLLTDKLDGFKYSVLSNKFDAFYSISLGVQLKLSRF